MQYTITLSEDELEELAAMAQGELQALGPTEWEENPAHCRLVERVVAKLDAATERA